jgi:hypothetical protein
MAAPHATENYIPDAQIWGDGRIVWVEYAQDGGRRVSEGKLDKPGVAALLKGAVDQGFFAWEELYTERLAPKDQPTKCLQIQADGLEKRVCEYYRGAPQAFHDFYQLVSSGAGLSGKELIPAKAYLKAYPQGPVQAEQLAPEWDVSIQDLRLDQAVNGVWVEGPALEQAWNLINAHPWGTTVRQGDQLYLISLQVPGISLSQPPAE